MEIDEILNQRHKEEQSSDHMKPLVMGLDFEKTSWCINEQGEEQSSDHMKPLVMGLDLEENLRRGENRTQQKRLTNAPVRPNSCSGHDLV